MEGRSFEKWYWSLYLLILLYKKLSKTYYLTESPDEKSSQLNWFSAQGLTVQIYRYSPGCVFIWNLRVFLNSRGLAKFSSLQLWNWLRIPLTAVIQVPLLAFRDLSFSLPYGPLQLQSQPGRISLMLSPSRALNLFFSGRG